MTTNTPAREALKACPFCGSDETSHGFTYAGVLVGHCGCEACDASVSAESEEEAIEKWNRRPAPEDAPQQGEVSELDQWLIDQLKAWPDRVHEERTTNIETLMKLAATLIERLTAEAASARISGGEQGA